MRPTSIGLGQMRGFTLESKRGKPLSYQIIILLLNMVEQKLFLLSTFLTVCGVTRLGMVLLIKLVA
jgi:hypothetical protein